LSRCKKVCSRLNVPTAAKLQWSLSSPQRANQLTVKPAFQNADLRSQKVSARQTVSIRNKCGHGEERIGKETMRLASLLCSNGLTVHTTRKLFRKKRNKESELEASLQRKVDARKFFSGLIRLLFLTLDPVLLS
jgi:hypothetical protein